MIFIISSPSGGGKGTIIAHLLKVFPNLEFSVSATSRKPREGEVNGVNYYFVSPEEFRRKIENDELVEYEEVYSGSFYGTPKSEIERISHKGNHVVFEVDVKGGMRLDMVQLAVGDIACLRACDVEFGLPRPSYTWRTLQHLSHRHPHDRFSLIIGSDNLAVFDRWRNYVDILTHYSVVVYPRTGDDVAALQANYPMVRFVEATLLPISSTQVRAMLRRGEDASLWLDSRVFDYINQHHLYGLSETKGEVL